MMHSPLGLRKTLSTARLAMCLFAVAPVATAAANEVVQWNETTMKAIDANGQSAIVSTRTLAMVQVAVHDALNAISRRYDAYYFEGPGRPGRVARRRGRGRRPHGARRCGRRATARPLRRARRSPWSTRPMPRRSPASPTAPPGTRAWRSAARPARRSWRFARTTAPPATRPTRRAWVPASGGRIRTPFPPTRPSPIRTWLAATCLRRFRAGANVTPFTLLSASQFWLPGPPALTSADLRARLQRGEERRRQGQHGPYRRPDADRALLVRGAGRLEHDRAHGGHLARPRCQGQRPGPGPHEHGDGGRLHRGLQDPLRVRSRGARSPPFARATTTATTPPSATRPGTVIRTPRRSRTIRRRKAPSARRPRWSSPVPWAATRPASRSRAASPSKGSPDRSRASLRRRGRAPTPASMPASTSAAPARTGSPSGARSASGRRRSTSSLPEVRPRGTPSGGRGAASPAPHRRPPQLVRGPGRSAA